MYLFCFGSFLNHGHRHTSSPVFGFVQTGYGSIKFNRCQIGIKRYLCASVSVARSLTRLRSRGLMILTSGFVHGLQLTLAGKEVAKKLFNNG